MISDEEATTERAVIRPTIRATYCHVNGPTMSSSDIGLPGKIASFVDKNGDTLQNMALLAYLKKGEEAKPFLETVTTAKVSVYCPHARFSSLHIS